MIPLLPDLSVTQSPNTSAGATPLAASSSPQSGAGLDFAELLGAMLPETGEDTQPEGSPFDLASAVPTMGPTPTAIPLAAAPNGLVGDTPLPALRLPRGTILPEAGTRLPQAPSVPVPPSAPDGPTPVPALAPAPASADKPALAPPQLAHPALPPTPSPLVAEPAAPPAPVGAAHQVKAEAIDEPFTAPARAAPLADKASDPLAAAPVAATEPASQDEPTASESAAMPETAAPPTQPAQIPAQIIVPILAVAPAPAPAPAPVPRVTAAPAPVALPATRALRHPAARGSQGEDASLPARVTLPASASDGASAATPAALPVDPAAPAAAAAPAPTTLTLIAAAPSAPTPLIAEPAAPRSQATQQEAAIAQVGELREALRAARPEMTLRHAEFGQVSLRIEPAAAEGWRAVLASRDPGFVPAIQAALAERAVAATTDTAGTGTGAPHNGGGDQRYGSSPNIWQGSHSPYLGQSQSRNEGGSAHPQQRQPSTTDAVANRVGAAETEQPDSSERGVFA